MGIIRNQAYLGRVREKKMADQSVADNYSVLMSYFTRQHNVEPQDIRAYLGVGPDYEDLC